MSNPTTFVQVLFRNIERMWVESPIGQDPNGVREGILRQAPEVVSGVMNGDTVRFRRSCVGPFWVE